MICIIHIYMRTNLSGNREKEGRQFYNSAINSLFTYQHFTHITIIKIISYLQNY